MKAEHLEILVEEPSMEAFLTVLLPGLLGDKPASTFIRFNAKTTCWSSYRLA